MNTAEYIVKKLEELGVNDFFGVPGDYNFNLIYSIQNNVNTTWRGCTNELNAGYAADGYARIKGYGALVTTYGVGELSAINAVAGSMAENIPVMCIVGVPETELIKDNKLVHHNLMDVNYKAFIQAYESVTATTTFLTRDNARIEIDRVFKIFVKEKKPVYIAIPDDIATMEISDRDVSYDWSSDSDSLSEAASKIADKINLSDSPVILGDSLIKRFDSVLEYKEFVSKSGIPTTNFSMGTNIIDMNLPNYIGSYFSSFENSIAENYINNTDCLISIGAIYSDINAYGFNLPIDIKDHIAIFGTYSYIDGKKYDDIKMADLLEAISELVEPRAITNEKPAYFYESKQYNNTSISCDYIYPRIQEFIKENDIVIADTGTVAQGISKIKFPSSVTVESQALWASIGWATPAAFGAAVAKDQTRVVVITGDGAHQMTAMEVGSIIKANLKPVFIVINNNGYSIERLLCNDETNTFNDIVNINYSKLPRIFEGDVWSTRVSTNEDFDKALKVTQIMKKLCYIEICTSSNDVPMLSKNLAEQSKKITSKEKSFSAKTQPTYDNKNIVASTFQKDMEFETIVHTTELCDNDINDIKKENLSSSDKGDI